MAAFALDRVCADPRSDGVDFRALFVIRAIGREHEHVSPARRWNVWVGLQENCQVNQAGDQPGAGLGLVGAGHRASPHFRRRISGVPLISSYELITEGVTPVALGVIAVPD